MSAGLDKDGKPLMDTSKYVHGKWGTQEVSYNTRDLLLYAVGIGCGKESRTGYDSNHKDIKFIYEKDKNFAAFPTYPVLLTQKGNTQDIDTNASADYYMNLMRPKDPNSAAAKDVFQMPIFKGIRASVDAERYIERVRTLPCKPGDIPKKMTVRRRLIGAHKKGSGALVETESELIDDKGNVYYKFITADFMIGAYGFTETGITKAEKVNVPKRAPDAEVELETTPEQAHMYRLSSDYNPMHINPNDFGVKGGGFPAPILHGLCTLGHSARSVLLAFAGNDPERFHALKLRFASPVIPGDTLVTKMWKIPAADTKKSKTPLPEGAERIVFTTQVKKTGKVVIANAFLDILPAAAKAKL